MTSNPYLRDTFNLTEPMRLTNTNPALATRLKAEAKEKGAAAATPPYEPICYQDKAALSLTIAKALKASTASRGELQRWCALITPFRPEDFEAVLNRFL